MESILVPLTSYYIQLERRHVSVLLNSIVEKARLCIRMGCLGYVVKFHVAFN